MPQGDVWILCIPNVSVVFVRQHMHSILLCFALSTSSMELLNLPAAFAVIDLGLPTQQW